MTIGPSFFLGLVRDLAMLGEVKAGLFRITRDADPHDSVHGQQDDRGRAAE